ncbi:MAG TPA: S1/P1 nuclease [Candidatus Angelobacter sp.]|nr:S1/P1 nuclease [Candidatus Angelobacter sp.]
MKKIVAVLALIGVMSTYVFAWGPKGHRIVGDIAMAHLSESAKRNLQTLLGTNDLASVANWADDIKGQRPETYAWHFVDIPAAASGFQESRDCYRPDEKHPSSKEDHHNCVVDRISSFKQVLADKSAPPEARIEALKFLVHFVGDIHQPLHAAEEARGGNDIHVMEFGSATCGQRPCNFHYAWDIALLEHTGRSESDYVAYLEKLIASKNLQSRATGTPEDWANESFHLLPKLWVKDGGSVDEAYFQSNIGVLDERLALAGLRLAAVINEVLG